MTRERCKDVPKDGMSSLNVWTALLIGAYHKHGARVPTEAEETSDGSSGVALPIPGSRSGSRESEDPRVNSEAPRPLPHAARSSPFRSHSEQHCRSLPHQLQPFPHRQMAAQPPGFPRPWSFYPQLSRCGPLLGPPAPSRLCVEPFLGVSLDTRGVVWPGSGALAPGPLRAGLGGVLSCCLNPASPWAGCILRPRTGAAFVSRDLPSCELRRLEPLVVKRRV